MAKADREQTVSLFAILRLEPSISLTGAVVISCIAIAERTANYTRRRLQRHRALEYAFIVFGKQSPISRILLKGDDVANSSNRRLPGEDGSTATEPILSSDGVAQEHCAGT